MIKVILFDADGVTILNRSQYKYFSDKLASEKGISKEKIIPFFKNEFVQCQLGRKDLKVEIKKYLENWHWDKSIDEFLEYWHTDCERNEAILQIISQLRRSGMRCFLATDQDKYRAKYVLKNLNLIEWFDGLFFSCDLGFSKSSRQFFEKIMNSMPDIKADEIMYWDDDKKNVEVARALGIQSVLYDNFEEFKKVVDNLK